MRLSTGFLLAFGFLSTLPCVFCQGNLVAHGGRAESAVYTVEPVSIRVQHSLKITDEVSKLPRVSLVSVMDNSGSMAGRKMDLVKVANIYVAEEIAKKAQEMGLITFNSKVVGLIPFQTVDSESISSVSGTIRTLKGDGNTDIAGGLFEGLAQIPKETDEESFCKAKFVFLLSDGNPTSGVVDASAIVEQFESARERTIRVTTFPFGRESNYELLQDLAAVGDGESYPINIIEDVAEGIADALASMFTTVTQDINVILTPMNGANITEVQAGGKVTREGSKIRIVYPSLSLEEQRTPLINMDLPASKSGTVEILKAEVSYFDLLNCETVKTKEAVISLTRTTDVRRRRQLLQAPPGNPGDEMFIESFWRFTCFTVFTDIAKALRDDPEGTAKIISMLEGGSGAIQGTPEFPDSLRLQLYDEAVLQVNKILESEGVASNYTVALIRELGDAFRKQRASVPNLDTIEGFNFLKEYDTPMKKAARQVAKDRILSDALVAREPDSSTTFSINMFPPFPPAG